MAGAGNRGLIGPSEASRVRLAGRPKARHRAAVDERENHAMHIHRYQMDFLRVGGCPLGVVQDMARFDRATVLSVGNDLKCDEGHVRSAVMLGDGPPTMDRWRSFIVGARVRSIVEAGAHPDGEPPAEKVQSAEDAMLPASRGA